MRRNLVQGRRSEMSVGNDAADVKRQSFERRWRRRRIQTTARRARADEERTLESSHYFEGRTYIAQEYRHFELSAAERQTYSL